MEESRLQASYMLQSSLQSNGDRRYATPPQQIAAYNRTSVLQPVAKNEDSRETPSASSHRVIFGDDVSRDLTILKKNICNIMFIGVNCLDFRF